MTQEDKELLLRDLSARLPYGVYISPVDCGKAILIGIKDGNPLLWDTIQKKEYDKPWDIEFVKPYLRPMSSMTEEEKKEYKALCIEETFTFGTWQKVKWYDTWKSIDWLNKKMFAYRTINGKDMFELGIALRAPEGMYK